MVFTIIPVKFNVDGVILDDVGFTTGFESATAGSQANLTTFNHQKGLSVKINFRRDPAVITVNDMKIMDVVSLSSTLSALLFSTILGTCKAGLPIFEKYYYGDKKKIKSAKYSLISNTESSEQLISHEE